jgi:uncharacterized protein YodC (DUF2158 family)
MNPGDIVYLKSGGPAMTFVGKVIDGRSRCQWFVDGELKWGDFLPEVLQQHPVRIALMTVNVFPNEGHGTCEDCYFWKEIDKYGECRANPPITPLGWPNTSCGDWCGQFQPRPEKT